MTISERINKKFNSHGTTIEESIKNAQVGGGGVMIMHATQSVTDPDSGEFTLTLDKTWQEINDAFVSGKICIVQADLLANDVDMGQSYTIYTNGYVVATADEHELPDSDYQHPHYTVDFVLTDYGVCNCGCNSSSDYPIYSTNN